MDDDKLKELRRVIDSLDTELLQILARRMTKAREVGEYKRAHGLPTYDQQRWHIVLRDRLAQAGALNLSKHFVATLFEVIHSHALEIESETEQDEDFQG